MVRQAMSETKLRKMTEYNDKLKEQLEIQRIPVSDASKSYVPLKVDPTLCITMTWPCFLTPVYSLIEYCKSNHDTLVPSVWGSNKNQDPFVEQSGCTCCV